VNGGSAYEGEMNEVALFENALRAAVPTQPDPMTGADLVRRLAATARAATLEAETRTHRRPAAGRPRSRFALVAKVAVAVALIPLALAGLAFAGVNLPQPARDAFDSVGITLPNQPSEHSQKATDQGQSGGGNDVSGAAKSGPSDQRGNSAAAHQHARDQRSKAKGKAIGHTRGKAIGLNEGTPPGQAKEPQGQAKEPGPPANANESGQAHSQRGSAPQKQSSTGGASSHPFPPQANGKAVGRSK
jgi:hypothetical protein